MKDRKDRSRAPILAAGGIVLRGARRRHVAVVHLRKMDAWVLPKGKLADGEDAITAARREVLEETGHRVAIHEFLGTLAYEAGSRPKVVSFWRMQAIGGPAGELMHDVRAVQWLPLDDAIELLTHAREQAFLQHVGPIAVKAAERSVRRTMPLARPRRKRLAERARVLPPTSMIEPTERLVAIDVAVATPLAEPIPAAPARSTELPAPHAELLVPAVPATSALALRPPPLADPGESAESAAASNGRNVLERTWVWLRQAAQPIAKRTAG